MNEAIGYDRVSTIGQATKGVMLAARAESIPAYCRDHKLTLLEYYTDPGISGRTGKKRPGHERAMNAACHPGRVLVVDSLARFARSNIDADRALQRLQAAGADIVIISLGIDTRTASGRLIYRIMSAAAEFESDLIGERIRDCHAYLKKSLGYTTMGRQPLGLALDDEGNRVADPTGQEIIAAVKRVRRQNREASIRKLCELLDTQGVKTPGEARTGVVGKWRPEAVRRILKQKPAGRVCPTREICAS
jgi:DNA invertase Pin-like site-specific DNA recombinase